ncbi:Hypothetical predicted protein [Podarcis lilfordi]|uniref:Uncharacterized protein n=1 Tax=Podarcis lilfordi TaxID=74358 RepID=A0AA35LCP3_9SAUR|nr:Hypothetical predicted protein [Podarcis lilfordi]
MAFHPEVIFLKGNRELLHPSAVAPWDETMNFKRCLLSEGPSGPRKEVGGASELGPKCGPQCLSVWPLELSLVLTDTPVPSLRCSLALLHIPSALNVSLTSNNAS